jgi:phosphoribosylformylglycinamidine cyclo-ligase
LTYADAGVDIAAGEKAVELIKAHVRSTFRSEVVGDVGGFGGLFAVDWKRFRDPLLVSSTDGVGTKSLVARLANRRNTIGIDCVAMSVDDIAAQGAEPLFFLDYISIGKLVPEEIDEIVSGVAEGCRRARCALLGGEMSEHPGVMEPGEFDLVGFAVGVVERSEVLPRDVRSGDRIVGFASPGLRCNGYSLARAALLERAGMALGEPAWPGAHHSLADVLLEPSAIYAPAMLALARKVDVHAFAHVTGGGIPGNLARVLPERCDGVVRRGTWDEPRIFAEIQRAGDVPDLEMQHVFNLGIGMLAVVAGDQAERALDVVRSEGHDAWPVGEIVEGHGHARVEPR